MFTCNSADVFVGKWSIYGASVTHLPPQWCGSDTPDAPAAAWVGLLVVPNWVSSANLAGRTAEVWFGGEEMCQVVIERVDRSLAFFRGLGPPPSSSPQSARLRSLASRLSTASDQSII